MGNRGVKSEEGGGREKGEGRGKKGEGEGGSVFFILTACKESDSLMRQNGIYKTIVGGAQVIRLLKNGVVFQPSGADVGTPPIYSRYPAFVHRINAIRCDRSIAEKAKW